MFPKVKKNPGGMLFWNEGGERKVRKDYCSIFLVLVKPKERNTHTGPLLDPPGWYRGTTGVCDGEKDQ